MAPTSTVNSLDDLIRKYDLHIKPEDFKYEADIVKIFKLGIWESKLAGIQRNAIILYYIGVYYTFVSKAKYHIDSAIHYYKLSADFGNACAYNNLAFCYEKYKFDLDSAKKYYLMAIDTGLTLAMSNLGNMFFKNKDYEQSKIYYLMAIKNNHYSNNPIIKLNDLYADKHITFSQEDLDIVSQIYKDAVNGYWDGYWKEILLKHLDCKAKYYIFKKVGRTEPACKKCELIDLKIKNITRKQECDICKEPDIECIPYDWCYHFACVNCTHILVHKDSACPFCRRA